MKKNTRRECLIEIARKWMQFWQGGDLDNFEKVHAPNFVDLSPSGRPTDRDGFKKGIVELYAAFPDFHCVVEDSVVDEMTGKISLRWTASGTHQGGFFGLPPTHQCVQFKGIEILQIEKDRVVKRWGEWDGAEILRQLDPDASAL